jgi:hypothetical protein
MNSQQVNLAVYTPAATEQSSIAFHYLIDNGHDILVTSLCHLPVCFDFKTQTISATPDLDNCFNILVPWLLIGMKLGEVNGISPSGLLNL